MAEARWKTLFSLFGFSSRFFYSLWVGFFLGFSGSAKAAPCCARNAATPMLIVGDDRAQFNVGLALANVVAVADEEGIPTFGAPQNSEALQTYRLDGDRKSVV